MRHQSKLGAWCTSPISAFSRQAPKRVDHCNDRSSSCRLALSERLRSLLTTTTTTSISSPLSFRSVLIKHSLISCLRRHHNVGYVSRIASLSRSKLSPNYQSSIVVFWTLRLTLWPRQRIRSTHHNLLRAGKIVPSWYGTPIPPNPSWTAEDGQYRPRTLLLSTWFHQARSRISDLSREPSG